MGFYSELYITNISGVHIFDNDILSIFSENEIEISMSIHIDNSVIIKISNLASLPDDIQNSIYPFERVPGGRRE